MLKLPAVLLALILLLTPLAASADDASQLGPSTTTPTQSGSSNADSASLQPAGTSPLQSTTNDSTGLTAPDSSTLQAPTTNNDALSVISDDADGGPQQLSAGTRWWLWGGFTLLFALIAAAVAWLWRRRGQRHSVPTPTAEPAEAQAQSEPTSSQRLNVTVNAPVGAVFEFITNPANTPKWADAVAEEQASDTPPHLGSTYRDRDAGGHWTEYEVTSLSEGETFELTNHTNGYRVRYTLAPEGEDATYLEYFEAVDDGHIEHPFTKVGLEKLKSVLETPTPSEKPDHAKPDKT